MTSSAAEHPDREKRLLTMRRIHIFGTIDQDIADRVASDIAWLEHVDKKREISVYINSRGGSLPSAWSIIDAFHKAKPPIRTVCTGDALSAGSLILASGTPGIRLASTRSRIMIHQVSQDLGYAKASDHETNLDELKKAQRAIVKTLARTTSQSLATIKKDAVGDKWFSAQEARDYGLIDKVTR